MRRRSVIGLLAAASTCLSLATFVTFLAGDAPDFAAIHAGAQIAGSGGDPYDTAAVARMEARDEGAARGGALPYFYPPTMTALQLPLGALPYRVALRVWAVLIVVAAVGTVALAVRVVSPRRPGWPALSVALAAGLMFAPLRRGLQLAQVDPLLALPALAGVVTAVRGHQGRAGVALSALLLKPQLAAFPFVAIAASRRSRVVAGICAGALVQVTVVVALGAAGYRLDPIAWLHSVRSGDPHRPLVVAAQIASLLTAVACLASFRPWRHLDAPAERLLLLLSLGAVATAIAGPWVKLNPQSDVLLLIPATVLARALLSGEGRPLSPALRVGLGCVAGALAGDSLFAVTHYEGSAEAIVAVITCSLALTALALAVPPLAWSCAVASIVNAALTLPPVPPGYDGVVSAPAAAGLCVLLCLIPGEEDRRLPSIARVSSSGRLSAAR